MCDMMVKTIEFGSFSSGHNIIADWTISAQRTFGFSGASGRVQFIPATIVVLVASSSNFLIQFITSLCKHGKGKGAYLCDKNRNT